MPTQNEATGLTSNQKVAENTVFAILIAISVSHLLNDTIQSVIPAIYPILKDSFHLSFTQIGLITLTFQLTASLLQPFVGNWRLAAGSTVLFTVRSGMAETRSAGGEIRAKMRNMVR